MAVKVKPQMVRQ